MTTTRRPAGDRGYALVAAVTAVAAFGYLALQVLSVNVGGTAVASARTRQARLAAAADAGLALAIHALASEDRGSRWSPDRRTRGLRFDDIDLDVTVEDERGKAPLGSLTDDQVRALFSGAGAKDEQLEALVAEYRNWVTDPATGADPVSEHLPPPDGRPVRRGPMPTVNELAALPDMTPIIFARVAAATTVFPEATGVFDPAHASPLAMATMSADTTATPDALADQAATDAQKPDETLADDHLVGDTMTIRVVARDRSGARAHLVEIIELTGDRSQPFWVRYTE